MVSVMKILGKIFISVLIVLLIAWLTSFALWRNNQQGATLTQQQTAQDLFLFVLLYALISAVTYLALRKTMLGKTFLVTGSIALLCGTLLAIYVVIFDTGAAVRRSITDVTKDCTVTVLRNDGHGTGFSLTKGQVITNYHVVDGATELAIWDNQKIDAKVVKASKEQDLAILEVNDTSLPQCKLEDSETLNTGEDIFAIGWPNEPYGESTVTKGIYSRRVTSEEASYLGISNTQLLQTDASLNPGNSGGPMVNSKGIIGISVARIQGSEGLGYAIPSSTIKAFLDQ